MRIALDSGHIDVVIDVGKELERRGHTLLGIVSPNQETDLYLGAGPNFRYIEHRIHYTEKRFKLPHEKYNRLVALSHDLDWGPTEECQLCRGWLMTSQYKYNEFVGYVKTCALVGWPKMDILFKPEKKEVTEDVRKELDLKYDKTVLYAPSTYSFTDEGTSNHPTNVALLLKQFKDEKINLLIKEHIDWDWRPNWAGRQEAIEMAKEMPNVRWLDPRYPLIRAVLVSDVLMTWRFCCVFKEFMMKGPVIELRDGAKLEEVQFKAKPYPDTDTFKVPDFYHGLSAYSVNVMPSVRRALDNPLEFKDIRERMLKHYFYKPDGHAAERGADVIEEWFK